MRRISFLYPMIIILLGVTLISAAEKDEGNNSALLAVEIQTLLSEAESIQFGTWYGAPDSAKILIGKIWFYIGGSQASR